MKQITNLEERHQAVSLSYSGNFIDRLRENDAKYYNKLMKAYAVYMMDDGKYLVHEIETPSISSVISYDDETPRPEINETNFIDYNMWLESPLRFYEGKRLFIYNSQDKSHYLIAPNHHDEPLRIATEEETNTIMSLRHNANDEYLERLKAYFKRFSAKIRTSGYWANR